jgi:hypothetical protein
LRGVYSFGRGDLAAVTALIGIEQREGEAELSEALSLVAEDDVPKSGSST